MPNQTLRKHRVSLRLDVDVPNKISNAQIAQLIDMLLNNGLEEARLSLRDEHDPRAEKILSCDLHKPVYLPPNQCPLCNLEPDQRALALQQGVYNGGLISFMPRKPEK